MKTILKLIYPGIFIGLSWNYPCADKENTRLSNSKDWVKDVTKEYSPDSWELLMRYESLPERMEASATGGRMAETEKSVRTFNYLEGRNKSELLLSMATNIHEIAHAYSDQNIFRHAGENALKLDMYKAEQFFYYSPSRSFFISFPLKSLFPSKELKAVIPKNLRTFRFDTYIDGITSTQSEGVVGLLNELHAYYLESKFCFEMLEAYKIAKGSDASGLFEWVHNTQSKMTAFFEFDFFIKEYLLYMKRRYPAKYKELSIHKPFTEAYSTFRTSYMELTDKYLQKIRSEMASLNSSGKAKVSLENSDLWVREGNSRTSIGTSVFSKDREILMPVLQSDRYRELGVDFPGIK